MKIELSEDVFEEMRIKLLRDEVKGFKRRGMKREARVFDSLAREQRERALSMFMRAGIGL